MNPLRRYLGVLLLCLPPLTVGCAPERDHRPSLAQAQPSPAASAATPGQRAMAREIAVTLRAKTPAEVANNLTALGESMGGYVVSSEIRTAALGEQGANVTLRIPSSQVTSFLRRLKALAELLREQRRGDDITEQVVDTEARLVARRALEQRLLELLTTARAVEDMLKIETELSRVRTEIEHLTAQSRDFAQRTEMTSIAVTIESPEPTLDPPQKPFSSRFREALSSATSTSQSVVLGGVELLGALVPLTFLALAIWLPLRYRRRRLRHRQAAAAGEVAAHSP